MAPAATTTLTRRAIAVVALAAVLTLGGAATARAQEPPPTTAGLLVPGTTAPATTVAPASTTTTEAPDEEGDGLLDLDANEKVWVIVGGLVAVAILMLVLTVIYWRHTKPERWPQDREATKAGRKRQKRRRRATSKDPFLAEDETPAPSSSPPSASGPMDLDDLLGTPDPSRSVFGSPTEDDEPGR
jgi:hypothetical protein